MPDTSWDLPSYRTVDNVCLSVLSFVYDHRYPASGGHHIFTGDFILFHTVWPPQIVSIMYIRLNRSFFPKIFKEYKKLLKSFILEKLWDSKSLTDA